ncbi:MAG: hypothetical protein P1P82_00545 [Bacteroidales bacterium]|nr:hypothetical protein [Bacteroidales bacterium]MDT8430044.1 hypothetical protein [Bacteroidales bacterium]
MKKILFLVLVLLSGFMLFTPMLAGAHPLHVSVTNITMEENMLNISINTFVDDWETAYFHYYGKPIDLRMPGNTDNQWFCDYLEASFVVRATKEGEPMELVTDTITFNELSMKLELHINLKDQPKTLYIYHAMLTDIFADQTNLLIFSAGGKQKGIKFDYNNKEDELKLR